MKKLFPSRYIVVLYCGLPIVALAEGYDSVRTYVEQTFATSIVLTDSDVFTVGIHDFDPNEWFSLENEAIGSDESVSLRQQVAVSTLPYSFELSDENDPHKHSIFTRFSIIRSEQDFSLRSQDPADYNDQYVFGAFAAYRYRYQLTDGWTLTPGIGLHLQYFRNEHDYKSEFSRQVAQPVLDDVLFNTDAWALSYEPHIEAKYTKPTEWGSWNFSSAFHYFYGTGWGEANLGDIGNPEGWYTANGIEMYYNVTRWGPSVQSVYASLRRIDLGGDTDEPLDTPHYYEGSIGWLLTPPFESSWIDNVGLGLSINYGSAFKGGSIVFFFNQID